MMNFTCTESEGSHVGTWQYNASSRSFHTTLGPSKLRTISSPPLLFLCSVFS